LLLKGRGRVGGALLLARNAGGWGASGVGLEATVSYVKKGDVFDVFGLALFGCVCVFIRVTKKNSPNPETCTCNAYESGGFY
jgi:hypothetical protein